MMGEKNLCKIFVDMPVLMFPKFKKVVFGMILRLSFVIYASDLQF